MLLRMKNFNIFGVHWKIRLLEGFRKNQYSEGDCLKRGAWTVCPFKGCLARKRGWCFWGGAGWHSNAHYENGAKYEEKIIFCFKQDKNLVNFDLSTKKPATFALWLVPFVESIQHLTKKSTKGYISWHWRVMQNLEKNWPVGWKMTWGI